MSGLWCWNVMLNMQTSIVKSPENSFEPPRACHPLWSCTAMATASLHLAMHSLSSTIRQLVTSCGMVMTNFATAAVPHVLAFGRHIALEAYPTIGRLMIAYYSMPGAEDIMLETDRYLSWQSKLVNMCMHMGALTAFLETEDEASFGDVENYEGTWRVQFEVSDPDPINWGRFTRRYLHELQSWLEEEIAEKREFVDGFLDACPEHIYAIPALQLKHAQRAGRGRYDERPRLCFLTALEQATSELDLAPWDYQKHVSTDGMRYILWRVEHGMELPRYGDGTCLPEHEEKALRTMGLMAASGWCCKMEIAELPARVSWRMGEHDDQEHVEII